jgi:hypothetical protein
MSTDTALERIAAARPKLTPLDADSILARVLDTPPTVVDDPWRQRSGAFTRPRTLAVAVVAVLVAGAAGIAIGGATSRPTVTIALRHPPASRSGAVTQHHSSEIRARLLDALDAASSDVVGTHAVLADGQTADRWANADNTRSVEIISGTGEWPDSENLTTWDPTTGTTSLTIYRATRTWRETTQGPNGPRPIAPPSIRQQVADGVYSVVATGEIVDGHSTIELSSTSDDHVTSYLWVDGATDLPVQEASSSATAPTSDVDWTYLAPTPAALAKLQLAVPAGYVQVSCPPDAGASNTGCN